MIGMAFRRPRRAGRRARWRMPRFMRSAAKASVPSASAFDAASIDARRRRLLARCAQLRPSARSIAARSSAIEQVAVGSQRASRGQQHAARRRPAPRAARAPPCRCSAVREALLQHARDLVVGQAVGRLDRDRRLDARCPARARSTLSRPSASTGKVTRMRAAPATIGGMPRSSKRASERQSATSSRSPCTTWIAIAVWPSL